MCFLERIGVVELLPFMARMARAVLTGTAHHLTQRGVDRQEVFGSDVDREVYLTLVSVSAQRFGTSMVGDDESCALGGGAGAGGFASPDSRGGARALCGLRQRAPGAERPLLPEPFFFLRAGPSPSVGRDALRGAEPGAAWARGARGCFLVVQRRRACGREAGAGVVGSGADRDQNLVSLHQTWSTKTWSA